MPDIVTRFAPSPTGHLHLGHAFSALFARDAAGRGNGRFLLRIEDIDSARCRAEFEDAIYEDLAWLGLEWELPVRRQSDHLDDYKRALQVLEADGLLYPCFCTRKDIAAEIDRAGGAPHGAEGPVYPGTCRRLSTQERDDKLAANIPHALRLDVEAALARTGPLTWVDRGEGEIGVSLDDHGDVVLARKDIGTSYHLAVTVDDALQRISLVTRGADLFSATHVHRLLQALLGLPVPEYHHHPLITDDVGKRLAKRDKAATVRALRMAGESAETVRRRVGY